MRAKVQIRRFGVQIFQFGPFKTTIRSTDRQLHRFGRKTVKFDDWPGRPLNSTIGSANHEIVGFVLIVIIMCTWPFRSMVLLNPCSVRLGVLPVSWGFLVWVS